MNPTPTVFEVASARIRQIDREIEQLRYEREACVRRLTSPHCYTKCEAERIADRAEPLQVVPLKSPSPEPR